jgi:acyl carrier protein
MPISERLHPVFVQALGLPADINVLSLRQRYDERWDSVGHMSLVVAIEDEFQVELGPEDLVELDSFQTAVKILRDLGVRDD